MSKTPVLFMPKVTLPGTERYFHNYENPEKFGIDVRALTPRFDKHGYGFSVRSKSKFFRGYISSAGDCIVRPR